MFAITFVAKVSKPARKSERHRVEIAFHCTKYIYCLFVHIFRVKAFGCRTVSQR